MVNRLLSSIVVFYICCKDILGFDSYLLLLLYIRNIFFYFLSVISIFTCTLSYVIYLELCTFVNQPQDGAVCFV